MIASKKCKYQADNFYHIHLFFLAGRTCKEPLASCRAAIYISRLFSDRDEKIK